MKSIKAFFVIALIISSNLAFGQEPSFYDLKFGLDSTTTPYKASNTNYVFIRSKRGSEPVKATTSCDSIKSFVIQKIVLVFSETSNSELENREAYNQERWENLIPTYPQFFQAKTVYKNSCQCSPEASNPEYKQVQGFYIYYTPKAGSEPKKEMEVVKAETPKPTEPKKEIEKIIVDEPKKDVVRVETPKPIEPKKEVVKDETPKPKEPKKEIEKIIVDEPKKDVVRVETPKPIELKKETVKEEPKKIVEAPKKEEPKKTEVKVEEIKPIEVVKKKEPKKEVETNEEEVSDSKSKIAAPIAKPRRAKDPRACRAACYGTGEGDLNAFFRDKVVLTKKMKKDEVDLKLQLNVDGTIKKVIIIGDNAELNKLVEDAVKNMVWNASVKAGLTIKSEVRMVLKFDKESKGLKTGELIVNPRQGPKCLTCTSDEELLLK